MYGASAFSYNSGMMMSSLFLSAALAATVPASPGEKAAHLFFERLLSERARSEIFDETVNAFRTHYDDVHPRVDGKLYGYWQGEYWGKAMLSHSAYARLTGDAAEKAFVQKRAQELVLSFQREDGYLATYADADFVTNFCWNVWSRKYTMWALVEASDLTGDKRLLEAARKMAVHLDGQLKRLGLTIAETGFFSGIPSMSILKPLLLVYQRTGEPAALSLAKSIVAENDRADGRCPNLIANAFTDKPVHCGLLRKSGTLRLQHPQWIDGAVWFAFDLFWQYGLWRDGRDLLEYRPQHPGIVLLRCAERRKRSVLGLSQNGSCESGGLQRRHHQLEQLAPVHKRRAEAG